MRKFLVKCKKYIIIILSMLILFPNKCLADGIRINPDGTIYEGSWKDEMSEFIIAIFIIFVILNLILFFIAKKSENDRTAKIIANIIYLSFICPMIMFVILIAFASSILIGIIILSIYLLIIANYIYEYVLKEITKEKIIKGLFLASLGMFFVLNILINVIG